MSPVSSLCDLSSSDKDSTNNDTSIDEHIEMNGHESSPEIEPLTICIGNSEKSVAHSKLQALLAQLDQNNEFRSSPPKNGDSPATRSPTPRSPTQESPIEFKPSSPEPISINGSKNLRTRDSGKIVSTSPANFSFLVGSVPNQSDCERPPRFPKSFSTVEMTELEKTKISSKSEESLTIMVPSKIEQDVELEESKEKYRKCSSLRTGKTPPCTPGRRKIVR